MLKFTPLPAPVVIYHNGVVVKTVNASNSFPCRRCLKDGELGQEMLLLSYDPFLDTSVYSSPGPIFVHRDCEQYESNGSVPDQQQRRLLSVRAYDKNQMMVDFCVVKGAQLQEKAEGLLDQPEADFLHVHYASPGCFAVRVDRAST